jgi:putative acyl-CoA dehydrogenase
VLRALRRDPQAADLFAALAEIAAAPAGGKAEFGADPDEGGDEAGARLSVGRLAMLASAAALRATAPPVVAEAFARTRVAQAHGALYGAAALDARTTETLLQRALPER